MSENQPDTTGGNDASKDIAYLRTNINADTEHLQDMIARSETDNELDADKLIDNATSSGELLVEDVISDESIIEAAIASGAIDPEELEGISK